MGILGYTSAALGEGIYLLLEQENIVLMKFLFFFLRKSIEKFTFPLKSTTKIYAETPFQVPYT